MTTLSIPYLGKMNPNSGKDCLIQIKKYGVSFPVATINWPEYMHCPGVNVHAGYCDEKLWLNFDVKNDFMRVQALNDQEAVWEDSCVEFFMKHDENYRNFEFNSLGICLSAVGPNRNSRSPLPVSELNQILRFATFTKENIPAEGEKCDWELTVAIPLTMLGVKAGTKFSGNFYKCGDLTTIFHFLSWAPISTPNPDFHRPEFFAEIELAV